MTSDAPNRTARRCGGLLVGALLVGSATLLPSAPATALPATEVFVGDSTVIEGNGVQNAVARFPVRLSAPAATDVYVWFHTVDGSASHRSMTSPDGDFALKNSGKSKVRVPAGKVIADIGVPVYSDTEDEGDESFTVVIDHVTTTTTGDPDPDFGVARSPGTGTIIDDDPQAGAAELSIGATAVPEGSPTHQGRAKLDVRLSEPLATASYIYFHTEGIPALGGSDFIAKTTNSKVMIPAGKVRATITTTVLPDVADEGDEGYRVVIDKVASTIGGAHNPAVTIVDGTGEVLILDDDGVATVPDAPAAPADDWGTDWGTGNVVLTWTAPANDGGRSITHYTVERYNNVVDTWTDLGAVTGTTATFHCGWYGTTCYFRVTAHNVVGASAPSAFSAGLWNCFDTSCLV